MAVEQGRSVVLLVLPRGHTMIAVTSNVSDAIHTYRLVQDEFKSVFKCR